MRKGVVELTGLLWASLFGVLLGVIGFLTQSIWVPALVWAVYYFVEAFREGIVELRL